MSDKHVLTVPSEYKQVKQVCQFVAEGASRTALSEKDIFHIELACDEACTNIIEHAYEGKEDGRITVSWEVDSDAFIITIQDNGRSFNPNDVPQPPPIAASDSADFSQDALIENLKIGGLGIHFMRTLMDDVRFQFDDAGNTLVMKKNIG